MPVLVMQGGATQPIMSAVTEALSARMPKAQIAVIEGAGHMVPVTHPEAVAEVIGTFWPEG